MRKAGRRSIAIFLALLLALTGSFSMAFAEGTEDIGSEETVATEQEAPTISGLKVKWKKKAGKKMTDGITVKPAQVYTISLEKKNDKGVYKTQKTFQTNEKGKVTLTYPKSWYAREKSSWRIVVDATDTTTKYTGQKIAIQAKRVYQTPGKYYKVHDSRIQLKGGGYTVSKGFTGFKTLKINKKLGIGSRHYPKYTATTVKKVKAFQKKKGLKVTGKVDKKTWLAMGFSEKDWYGIGAYTSPLKISMTSTKKQMINAMVKRAKEYKKAGTLYTDGASGKPGQGADCSGLVMQCLYAVGINPLPSSAVRHSRPGYDFESRYLYKSKKLKKVSLRRIKKGDLVFFKNSHGTIIHVALYIGGGKCIESIGYGSQKVVQLGLHSGGRGAIAGVRRPLP